MELFDIQLVQSDENRNCILRFGYRAKSCPLVPNGLEYKFGYRVMSYPLVPNDLKFRMFFRWRDNVGSPLC